jgi:hypothetical protein
VSRVTRPEPGHANTTVAGVLFRQGAG